MTQLSNGCRLCPRQCGADRAGGTPGYCGVAEPGIYAARAALHLWEEPCISGETGSGAVFFSGCPLRCVYCQNYSIARAQVGKPISVERLAEIFLELQQQKAANINLVTPTHFAHILARVLSRPVPGGLPVVWNCGGYDAVSALRALEGKVDIYLPDLKYLSPERAGRYSAALDYPQAAQAAILEMYRQRGPVRFEGDALKSGVLIRHLLLPGGLPEARRVMDWVAESFPRGAVLFSLMAQYTPMGDLSACPEINRLLRPSEVRAARDYMAALGLPGYVQDLEAVGERFVPAFDLTGL